MFFLQWNFNIKYNTYLLLYYINLTFIYSNNTTTTTTNNNNKNNKNIW